MRVFKNVPRVVIASAIFVFMLLVASPTQGASDPEQPTLAALVRAGATVAFHSETGKLRFIGSRPGNPIARPSGLATTADPETVARAFLGEQGKAFGITNQSRELRTTSILPASAGRSSVRFQQLDDGVPVLGGEVVVNLDKNKDVLSASGELLPATDVSVEPRVTPGSARKTALATVARELSIAAGQLEASAPSLWIYDSKIMGGPGLDRPTLVWRMDVTGAGGEKPIDEFALVDAQLGIVALHFNQLEQAKNRVVCDATNTTPPPAGKVPCSAPYARIEGGGASGIGDVNDAYELAGNTYDFYSGVLGRDSIDGAGMPIVSTTRYCTGVSGDPCPYTNAYWDGSNHQMVYGQGYASADDVVAHELTHGVTDYTSNLFYYYQSGAINESFSDVFGELVDQTYDYKGTDSAPTKWLMGEDLSANYLVCSANPHAVRNMADPTDCGDPDRMSSPNYTADTSETDGGGVHTNSGVNNKAAFLMTDGGAFNGVTVTGLGIDKVARIYYETNTNLLTSAADYADLYSALQQACTNLVGTHGITSADCAQVKNAVDAVQMDDPPANAPNPEAPLCPAGQSLQNLYSDDFEAPLPNWTTITRAGSNAWYLGNFYATSGVQHLYGDDPAGIADTATAMGSSVTLPAGSTPYLHFRHAFGFDDDSSYAYDGGVLEYSTNGGSTWSDAGSLIADNGYNGTLPVTWGNPLGGRAAFTRESNGYISTRANLSSLAGQSIRFSFRTGTDSSVADYGWFIDDVRIYTCGGGSTTTTTTTTTPTTTTPAPTPAPAAKGKIVSAKLSKKSFTAAQAKTVKLTVKFSPKSKKFNYLLQVKKNGKWVKVKAVNRSGSFTTKTMTVKSIFAGKAVLKGAYRLKLSADANSKTVSFRVT